MEIYVQRLYGFVWGVPALALILGVGFYLSLRTRFIQIRLFPAACRDFWSRLFGKKQESTGVSSFQALCTALAATVGTGYRRSRRHLLDVDLSHLWHGN